jgi:hypothetical protein
MSRALSDERTGLSYTIAAGPRQHSHSRVGSIPVGLATIFYCLRFEISPLSKVKVRVTLQLVVYRQSVRIGARPLETHDKRSWCSESQSHCD